MKKLFAENNIQYRFIALGLILAFIVSLAGCGASETPGDAVTEDTTAETKASSGIEVGEVSLNTGADTEYIEKLFGSGVIDVQIKADETAWAEMLANAQAEEYISCDVTINGVEFTNVGIRPKGNSSLSQVVSSDSDRYSFRLKFDEYVDGQTCFGLSDFVLNNMMGDSTYMKEYISYDIMTYIGVDSPLYEFADITVNGESWGFYLAVEKYDDAFLERNYGDSKGELYNVKMTQGMGDRENFQNTDGAQSANMTNFQGADGESAVMQDFSDMPQFDESERNGNRGFGGMGASSGGGDLKYTDDSIESYASIFENGVGTVKDEEKQLVIEALKALSEGENIEEYFDVDQIIRYFAAHTVVVNLDSYVSNMAQNYYLVENDGVISILPWDYNFAFGAFQSGSASDIVNFAIDSPVSGVSAEDRPLLNMILESEEYLAKYHEYLQQILNGYFSDGKFAEKIAELDAKINEYVKNDPSGFYTYEQYTASLPVLTELGELRAESIQGQLDGTIPSTTEGQKSDSSSLIPADSINMSALGNSGMGGGNGGKGGMENMPGMNGGNMQNMDSMRQAMQIIQEAGGEITDEVKSKLLELGLTEEQITMVSQMGNRNQNIPRK